jgi:uncharacterized membrane protein YjjB (DUF3815 family)
VASVLLAQVVPTETTLIAMLVPCIFLIPGFQLINAGWELMRGHEDLGSSRLTFFLGSLLAITAGVLAVLLVYSPGEGGQGIVVAWPESLLVGCILAGLFALCFAPMVNSSRNVIIFSVICAIIGKMVKDVSVEIGADIPIAVLGACMVISIFASAFSRLRTFPMAVVLISASVQFVPGYYYALSLQGMWQLISLGPTIPLADISSMLFNLTQSAFISSSIVLGTLLPLLILAPRQWA